MALGSAAVASVVTAMQVDQRRRVPGLSMAWRHTAAGRVERVLHESNAGLHRGWLQPFLYLTLQK